MIEGNFGECLEKKQKTLDEMRAVYQEIRMRGLDLYRVGDYMLALPDRDREDAPHGGVLMTEADRLTCSVWTIARNIDYKLDERNNIMNRNKPDEEVIPELIQEGIKYGKHELKRRENKMWKLTTLDRLNLFSSKKMRLALEGEMPEINREYVDIHP